MNKPHYYYKTTDDGRVGAQLQEFMNRCAEAEEKARQWAEKVGASHYYESADGMAGGVGAVEFENTISKEGWEAVKAPDGRVLFVPIAGCDLEKEMFALPIVSETQLIGILDLIPRKTQDGLLLPFTFGNETPAIFRHHGYWYLDVPYQSAHIAVTQIDEKEFNRRRMAAINER